MTRSRAGMRSAIRNIRRAASSGTRRRANFTPPSTPTSSSGSPNTACSEATTTSHSTTGDRPVPRAAPFTAATTGTGQSYSAQNARRTLRIRRSASSPSMAANSWRSLPPQKWRPAPVRTTASTSRPVVPRLEDLAHLGQQLLRRPHSPAVGRAPPPAPGPRTSPPAHAGHRRSSRARMPPTVGSPTMGKLSDKVTVVTGAGRAAWVAPSPPSTPARAPGWSSPRARRPTWTASSRRSGPRAGRRSACPATSVGRRGLRADPPQRRRAWDRRRPGQQRPGFGDRGRAEDVRPSTPRSRTPTTPSLTTRSAPAPSARCGACRPRSRS